jgi:hypothetical protein
VCARECVSLRGSTYPPSHGSFIDSSSIPHSQNVSRSPSVPPLLAASLPPSKSRRGLHAEKQPNLGMRRTSTLPVPIPTLSPCETSTRSLKLRKVKNNITCRFHRLGLRATRMRQPSQRMLKFLSTTHVPVPNGTWLYRTYPNVEFFQGQCSLKSKNLHDYFKRAKYLKQEIHDAKTDTYNVLPF